MNRLSPEEIISLRSQLKLSRRALAELSGFGEASLARWESGELIQSESNDNLLRLLSIGENVRALQRIRDVRAEIGAVPKNRQPDSNVVHVEHRFEALGREGRVRATLEATHFSIKRSAGIR
jgi:transcriptional regulator with XRE-family HTH domain